MVLERIIYANEETGYTVALVSGRDATGGSTGSAGDDLLTAVSNLLGTQSGESLRQQSHWKSHLQYGRQFAVRA